MVSELKEEKAKLNDQIVGYQKFTLPISLTDEELSVKLQEGDTQRFDKFAKQSLI